MNVAEDFHFDYIKDMQEIKRIMLTIFSRRTPNPLFHAYASPVLQQYLHPCQTLSCVQKKHNIPPVMCWSRGRKEHKIEILTVQVPQNHAEAQYLGKLI